jgi:hypothetical protein
VFARDVQPNEQLGRTQEDDVDVLAEEQRPELRPGKMLRELRVEPDRLEAVGRRQIRECPACRQLHGRDHPRPEGVLEHQGRPQRTEARELLVRWGHSSASKSFDGATSLLSRTHASVSAPGRLEAACTVCAPASCPAASAPPSGFRPALDHP